MSKEIEQIIVRYFSGEAKVDDIILLSEWLSASENNPKTLQLLKNYWEADVSGVKIPNKEKSYPKLLSRIRKANKITFISRPWFQFANIASVVILVGICMYLYLFKTQYVQNEEQFYTYMSGNGISSFYLPDGTHITLNKSSELVFSNLYNIKERKVKLNGEAYFDVAHAEHIPFMVELDNSSLTVCGTIFNIRHKPEEKIIKATLLEGSILFDSPTQNVFILPDQQLTYNKDNGRLDIENIDTEVAVSWINSLIKYKSISFPEFLNLLKEYYDVHFTLQKELFGNEKLTGTFDANIPVEKILNLMKNNVEFNWEKEDNQYVITKNSSNMK